MSNIVVDPIDLSLVDDRTIVTYTAPSRKFGNLREELLIDAKNISSKFGPVYIALSGGIDSQIIVRSFMDAGADFEAFFIHSVGFNDYELQQIYECESFYGIKVKILQIDVLAKKEEWERRRIEDDSHTCMTYPFLDGVDMLEEDWPVVMCGPDIVTGGSGKYGVIVCHNWARADALRVRGVRKKRICLDFPNSPESMASQYCDELVKVFIDSKEYFDGNNLSIGGFLVSDRPLIQYNWYVKPLLKGKYFKKDILYFGKRTGYENYPDWIIKKNPEAIPPRKWDVHVYLPEVIEYLEKCDGTKKIYTGTDWEQYKK